MNASSNYFELQERVPVSVEEASQHVITVRRIFGLGVEATDATLLQPTKVPANGITLITGLSGSGKSTLLRKIAQQRPEAVGLSTIGDPDRPIVDLLAADVPQAIRWMSRFGLGEARLMTTPYRVLSDGQKVRTQLALLMWSRPQCIVIDEFLSVLDRMTARIVAYNLQKICRRNGTDAYLATARDDLVDAIGPDHLIEVELGGSSTTASMSVKASLPELAELKIGPGDAADFRSLARYHYIEHLASEAPLTEFEWDQTVTHVRVARHRDRVVAAAVFSRPVPAVLERLPAFRQLNERAIVILRVIVHPLYRGIGLTKPLLEPGRSSGLRCVVTCSALGLYFPFFLGAGLRQIEHPRNLRYPEHDELDARLAGLLESERFALNHYASAQRFYDRLPNDERAELRRIAETICVRSNVDYCAFVARLVELDAPAHELEQFYTQFFKQMAEQVPDDQFGTMISEALYFPVQGFYLPLEPSQKTTWGSHLGDRA